MSTPDVKTRNASLEASRKKRIAWKAGLNPETPLEDQLPRPFLMAWQVAIVMGLSERTVHESCRRYDACARLGDDASASREVPCVILGSTHRIPTMRFLAWWEGPKAAEPPEHQGAADEISRALRKVADLLEGEGGEAVGA